MLRDQYIVIEISQAANIIKVITYNNYYCLEDKHNTANDVLIIIILISRIISLWSVIGISTMLCPAVTTSQDVS